MLVRHPLTRVERTAVPLACLQERAHEQDLRGLFNRPRTLKLTRLYKLLIIKHLLSDWLLGICTV